MSTKISFATLKKEVVRHPFVYIKLVYEEDKEDILQKFIDDLVKEHGVDILQKVGAMPEGDTAEKLLDINHANNTINFCRKNNINFATRLHILYNIV